MVWLQNSTAAAFWGRFKRYLRSKHDLTARDATAALRSIRRPSEDDDESDQEWCAQLPGCPRGCQDVSESPHSVMWLQADFLQYFEEQQVCGTTSFLP